MTETLFVNTLSDIGGVSQNFFKVRWVSALGIFCELASGAD
jgi:hypothetical protein